MPVRTEVSFESEGARYDVDVVDGYVTVRLDGVVVAVGVVHAGRVEALMCRPPFSARVFGVTQRALRGLV